MAVWIGGGSVMEERIARRLSSPESSIAESPGRPPWVGSQDVLILRSHPRSVARRTFRGFSHKFRR